MSELGKPFLKTQIKQKNQCQNAASEYKKNSSEKSKFAANRKLGLEWNTTGLGKPFRKIQSKKSKKQ